MTPERSRSGRRRRTLAALPLIAIVLVVACFRGSQVPTVAPTGTLALKAPLGADEDSGPLRVVFASPKGQLEGPSEITVLFNKGMRDVDIASKDVPFPAVITPAIEGTWQWAGTRAATFIPSRAGGGGSFRLPGSTSFSVTIPKGTKSVDGDALAADYTFRFDTPRPHVVQVSPSDESKGLRPEDSFTLYFDQPVDEAEVAKNVVLTVADKAHAVKVTRAAPDNDKRFDVKPATPMPTDSQVQLTIKQGLKSKEGPLPSDAEQQYGFETYGPLVATDVRCRSRRVDKKCDPEDGLELLLANPVKIKDLKKAVTVDPPVKLRWPTWMDDNATYESVNLDGAFQPSKSYTIHVKGPLTDVYGQSLREPFARRMDFGDIDPVARIGLTNGVLEASAKRELSVGHINVADLSVGVMKLDEDTILQMSNDKLSFDQLMTRPGMKLTNVAKGRLNVVEHHKISLDAVLGDKGRGAFAVAVAYTDNGQRETDKSVAQVTDIGISARVSKLGTLVLVTRLGDAAPIADAEVKIRRPGKPGVVKKTDTQGFVSFEASDFAPSFEDESAVIFVKAKDDVAFKFVADTYSGDDFQPGNDGLIGVVFSDRGIYRPGETAHLKGILREPIATGTATPAAGGTVIVKVDGPDGEVVASVKASTTAYGTFAADVRVPATGRLGGYYISASRGTDEIASTSFDVAEFRASEFKVGVESDKPSYIRGDAAKWIGRGDYYYGAPMDGARAELAVSRSHSYFSPPNTDAFTTNDASYQSDIRNRSSRQGNLASSNVKLDTSGAATTSAQLDMPGQIGPEVVRCALDVTDITRQTISTSTVAIVHPAEHYVGVELDRNVGQAKKKVSPKFVAVKPNGDRVEGAALRVALIKRTWATAKQGTGTTSVTDVSTLVDTVVSSCALVSGKVPVSCDMTPPDAGQYIVRVTSEDSRKNPVAASLNLYVSGDTADVLSPFPERDSPTISLVSDKEEYDVGDTAKIVVKSPWKTGDALVTIERAGIYEKRSIKLSGAAPTIDVPITEAMRPNAFVTVVVLKGRTKKAPATPDKPDVGAPDFQIGQLNLNIGGESKRLAVDVKPSKPNFRPGEEIEVAMKVADGAGAGVQSELTVYAVDEGVLSLTDYKTPDPLETFTAQRPLRVATLETRTNLASIFEPLSGVGIDKGLTGGGGDGPSPSGVRADFRPSAYFNAAVITDASGAATVKFKLPDTLTTYRIMAVAVAANDRFGSSDATVTTSRQLMARPALPRFMRAGDTFEASVVVASKATVTQEVDVTAKFFGVVVRGETKKHVTVEPGKNVEVRFAVDAPRVGGATFQFDLSGGVETDAVRIDRRVQIPLALESVALYGDTESATATRLGDLSEIRPDIGELTVTTSSTALVGLDAGSDQLLDYPYGCTEQLTSRLVPLVALKELATDFKLKLPANLNDVVEKTVAKILTHQTYSGAFGFWPDSPEPSAWATVYALWGLDQAKKKGYPVPDSAMERASHWLAEQFSEEDEAFRKDVGAFMLYVLAEMGKPDAARASVLFDDRSKLPLYSKALLLSAMALGKADSGSISDLVTELEAGIRLDGNVARTAENLGSEYAVYLDSNARTTAMVLRALLHANPQHPLGSKLAMGLLADREGGQFRSTQEGAWALLALGDYRRAQEATEPNFSSKVYFGEAIVGEHEFRGRSITPAIDSFPAGKLVAGGSNALLTFETVGDGKVFYEARLRYARKTMPIKELDRGFYVQRRLRRVTADTLDEALATVPDATLDTFNGGDLVLADIVVVTPKPRKFVAIDDALPAGFEAVDMRLSSTSTRLGNLDNTRPESDEDDRAMERAEGRTYYTREVRDDRVLFFVDDMPAGVFRYRYLARATALGTFVAPPTRAEEMYAPEVFGRTSGGTIRVEAR